MRNRIEFTKMPLILSGILSYSHLLIRHIANIPVWMSVIYSTLLPETAGEENDDWENLKTADEHEEGADVLGGWAEDCP